MKQENKMKQQMNQVNPKAGTLKQKMNNWNKFQNASRKLIASVMMLAIITMNPGFVNAGVRNEDTCCSAETTKMDKLVKVVRLSLPSSEMFRKADTEAHRNMVRSIHENKVKNFNPQFAISDKEISRTFVKETTVSVPVNANMVPDTQMNAQFQAENIDLSASIAKSDSDINDIFQAEYIGIKVNVPVVSADEQMNRYFLAENISVPGNESFSTADAEMNRNLEMQHAEKYAKNSVR
jgi:hypothetical protein